MTDIQNLIQKISSDINALGVNIDSQNLAKAVEEISSVSGNILISGIGKTGLIGQLFAAGLRSVGVKAHFIHSTEGSHGDMGVIKSDDLIILLSKSGSSSEIFNMVDFAKQNSIRLMTITMNKDSYLGKNADISLILPKIEESSPISMMPSNSNVVFVAIIEIIKVLVAINKDFSAELFVKSHPGGRIGNLNLEKLMITGAKLPLISKDALVEEAIYLISSKYLGCVVVVDSEGNLEGVFTDGDLRRKIKEPNLLSKSVGEVMTKNPVNASMHDDLKTISSLMVEKGVNQIIICEEKNKKVRGLLNLNTLIKYEVIDLDIFSKENV